jgi:hypothetical protein
MIKAIRTLVLGLGLLGSATLTGLGPLSAHTAQARTIYYGPVIQASGFANGVCGVNITGSRFTPGGTVDVYVSMSGSFPHSIEVTLTATPGFWEQVPPLYGPWVHFGGGDIDQRVYTTWPQGADTVQVQAYDTASQQWSNTTVTVVSCPG